MGISQLLGGTCPGFPLSLCLCWQAAPNKEVGDLAGEKTIVCYFGQASGSSMSERDIGIGIFS